MGNRTSRKRTLPTSDPSQPRGNQGGEGWVHLYRSCYQKWNTGCTGNSCKQPRASCWRRWQPCCRLWAGGNLAVTPYGLWHVIMGGGDQDARPWSPFAEEALEGCSTTEMGGVSDCFPRQFKKDTLVYDVTLQSLKLPLYSATIQKRSNQGCLGGAAG